jgi:hypothetical protein
VVLLQIQYVDHVVSAHLLSDKFPLVLLILIQYANNVIPAQLMSINLPFVLLILIQYVNHVVLAQLMSINLSLVLPILIQYVSGVLYVYQGITLLEGVEEVQLIDHVQRVLLNVWRVQLLLVYVVATQRMIQRIALLVTVCSACLLRTNGETTLCATDITMKLMCVQSVQHA